MSDVTTTRKVFRCASPPHYFLPHLLRLFRDACAAEVRIALAATAMGRRAVVVGQIVIPPLCRRRQPSGWTTGCKARLAAAPAVRRTHAVLPLVAKLRQSSDASLPWSQPTEAIPVMPVTVAVQGQPTTAALAASMVQSSVVCGDLSPCVGCTISRGIVRVARPTARLAAVPVTTRPIRRGARHAKQRLTIPSRLRCQPLLHIGHQIRQQSLLPNLQHRCQLPSPRQCPRSSRCRGVVRHQ